MTKSKPKARPIPSLERLRLEPVAKCGHHHSAKTSWVFYKNLMCGICHPWVENRQEDQDKDVLEAAYKRIKELTDFCHLVMAKFAKLEARVDQLERRWLLGPPNRLHYLCPQEYPVDLQKIKI